MRPILQAASGVQHNNDVLHSISEMVYTPVNAELIKDMKYYLDKPGCVGLSAVQLGEAVRIIGVKRNEEILFIINPVIDKHSKQTYRANESCFSIGHGKIPYEVRRYKQVKVRGLGVDGKIITLKGRELFGAVLQHEIDHLNGITIDRKGENNNGIM